MLGESLIVRAADRASRRYTSPSLREDVRQEAAVRLLEKEHLVRSDASPGEKYNYAVKIGNSAAMLFTRWLSNRTGHEIYGSGEEHRTTQQNPLDACLQQERIERIRQCIDAARNQMTPSEARALDEIILQEQRPCDLNWRSGAEMASRARKKLRAVAAKMFIEGSDEV